MPITYRVDGPSRMVFMEVSGRVAEGEAGAALARLLREAEPGMSGLVDVRALETTAVFGPEVRSWVALGKQRDADFAGTRWAVVVADPTAFGLSRIYETLRADAPFEVRTFRAMEPARAWLGLDTVAPTD